MKNKLKAVKFRNKSCLIHWDIFAVYGTKGHKTESTQTLKKKIRKKMERTRRYMNWQFS